MNKLETFVNRLKVIGTTVELASNYPFIYITKINNIAVLEKHRSEHAFCIAMVSLKGDVNFIDNSETFKLIRKYTSI